MRAATVWSRARSAGWSTFLALAALLAGGSQLGAQEDPGRSPADSDTATESLYTSSIAGEFRPAKGFDIFRSELDSLTEAHGDRLRVVHHLDTTDGFVHSGDVTDFVGRDLDADFYICGPGAYMDIVEDGLTTLGVAPAQRFIERFDLPDEKSAATEPESATRSVVIRLDRKKHTLDYQPGDTILEAARRAGLRPPFSCESGSCATCMAHLDAGSVRMRVNNALSAAEVEDGWVLTCQAVPTSPEVVINYDA